MQKVYLWNLKTLWSFTKLLFSFKKTYTILCSRWDEKTWTPQLLECIFSFLKLLETSERGESFDIALKFTFQKTLLWKTVYLISKKNHEKNTVWCWPRWCYANNDDRSVLAWEAAATMARVVDSGICLPFQNGWQMLVLSHVFGVFFYCL